MINHSHELEKALGISSNSARIYFAALQYGSGTLTELARHAELSRTTTNKPLQELIENKLLAKRLVGKRIVYTPLNPQQLPTILEYKRQKLIDISTILLQQISVPDQDLQVRWHSGISGIQTGIKEFFSESKGKYFREFENPNAFDYIDYRIGEFAI
ncbi:MAG: hypothetical protein A3C11_02435 [Candidatus Sungbacteria bacterium RIFCSPHIGHO2_02_FULL_49_12]|uniref:Transcription regulator TrmB N-terminal domain-containing protein n=1 Tax=Candidatus Sungbacteria bacterium RIFCSPHIGHO2_02_FULL_49_12 TaxID=1802271 RepID=A0A1G2KQ70_9BACT|nr:MAG: hypothetical protein A3C11_02435 [Candidatus Sungbacteria bacterium RIFCSPHIGHO2_02_FULL_49_12]